MKTKRDLYKSKSQSKDYSEAMTSRCRSITKNKFGFKSLMRSIPRTMISSGAYGSYYKYLPSLGLKVINEIKYESKSTYRYVVDSKMMDPIFREVALFNLFYGKDLASVVIAYQYDSDKKLTYYYPAILMPHFSGKHPSDLKRLFYNSKNDLVIYQKGKITPSGLIPLNYAIQQCGNRSGIFFHDIHSGNVIIDKNKKPWIIDFSSELIQYFGSHKRLESRVSRLKEKFRTEIKELLKNN